MRETLRIQLFIARAEAAGLLSAREQDRRVARDLGETPDTDDLGPGQYAAVTPRGITVAVPQRDPDAEGWASVYPRAVDRVEVGTTSHRTYEPRTGETPDTLRAARLVGCERCGRYHRPIGDGADHCEARSLERDRLRDRKRGEIKAGGFAENVTSTPHSEPVPCLMCDGRGCAIPCGSACPNPDYCLCHCHGIDASDNPDANRCAACDGATGWTHRRVIPAGIVQDWAQGSLPTIPARNGGMVALALAAQAKREAREARDLAIGTTRGRGEVRSKEARERRKARKAAKRGR